MEEISHEVFFEQIMPIHSYNTLKALFCQVDFEDTVKLISDIPDLEKIALSKYNKHVHTLLRAVHLNKLHIVKWICSHGFENPSQIILETASKKGHIEILIWLIENTSLICNQRVLDIAACNGQFNIVKWIYENTYIRANIQSIEWVYEGEFYTLANWLKNNTPELNNYLHFNNSNDLYNYLKQNIKLLFK